MLLLLAALFSLESFAGPLASVSLSWNSFSFAPKEEEATPNYYAYGPGLKLGYSFGQVFDVVAYGSYLPAKRRRAAFGKEDVNLFGYGGELAFRFDKAVYFNVHGGPYKYQLIHRTRDDELSGEWAGIGGGLGLGAIFPVNKSNFWQVSLEFTHIGVTLKDEIEAYETNEKRTMDVFTVALAYVFNANVTSLQSGIFGDFMRSLGY